MRAAERSFCIATNSFRRIAALRLQCLPVGCITFALAVSSPAWWHAEAQAAVPQRTARDLAADAVANEIKVLKFDEPYLRYQMHLIGPKGDKVRDVIESKDGTVARLILEGGKQLPPDADAAERERLQAMLDSPGAFARHIKSEENGKKLALDLIKMMPDAMIFSYAPGQPQRNDRSNSAEPEVVIDFRPNPDWKPPSMTAEALTGLQGRAWIDSHTHFVTRLDGDVFRGVNFGWGLFAHIYPGGKLSLEQAQVAGQRWIFSRFTEHVTVRALMLKTYKEDSEVTASSFNVVPAMSYQDAVRLLFQGPLPSH